MQTKANIPRPIAYEAERAIALMSRISELLKHQRRHFDDAVVTHCIRLINDYIEENVRELPSEVDDRVKDHGRRV